MHDQLIENWLIAYLFVFRKTNSIVKRKDEALEELVQEVNLSSSEFTKFIFVQHKH